MRSSVWTGIIALCALLLTGCAGSSYRLISEADSVSAMGYLHRELNAPPSMSIDIAGKRYEGSGFRIVRDNNLAELQRRFGYGSKHYERITSGLDTDHLIYSAQPELKASDGTAMRCTLNWTASTQPAGQCVYSDGRVIRIRTE